METVADFKREVIVGKMVSTVYHHESKRDEAGKIIYNTDGLPEYTDKHMGTAPISKVQKTQFAVARVLTSGEIRDAWCQFPKASLAEVKGDSITIFVDCNRRGRTPILTYTLVN